MQLVISEEFMGLNQKKLPAGRKTETFDEHFNELLEKKFLESGCAALLVHQDNEQNIIVEKLSDEREALTAIGAVEDISVRYSIPAHLTEALDKIDGYGPNFEIPKNVID